MGLIKTIIIVFIVAFFIAAMFIWFPDETKEVLYIIFTLGKKLLNLIWSVLVKLSAAVVKWLAQNK